jgi:muconolactone delta-isomerase
MQFFVHLGIRTKSVPRETLTTELLGREIETIKELLASGKAQEVWKRVDCHCVILLVCAFSEQECRGVLAGLPFAKAGILDIQLIAPVEPYVEVYPNPAPA